MQGLQAIAAMCALTGYSMTQTQAILRFMGPKDAYADPMTTYLWLCQAIEAMKKEEQNG